jgi:hypothetical protein
VEGIASSMPWWTACRFSIFYPKNTAAFCEYIADVRDGRFPDRSHLVGMEAGPLEEVTRTLGRQPPRKKD